jgi:hypothetical protein
MILCTLRQALIFISGYAVYQRNMYVPVGSGSGTVEMDDHLELESLDMAWGDYMAKQGTTLLASRIYRLELYPLLWRLGNTSP